MPEQQLLERYLKYQIRIIKKELKESSSSSELEVYYTELKNKIRNIIDNLDELLTLDLDKIKENIKCLEQKDIKFISFCKITQESKFIELKEYDIGYLRQIFAKIDIEINHYFEEINILKKPYLEKLELLKGLLDRVQNIEIEENDIEILYDLIKEEDFEEAIKLIRALSILGIENKVLEETKEENIFEKVTNLELNDLIELFKKYNINFNDFNKNAQEELKKYGNLENIESILNLFNEQNIPLASYMGEIKQNNRTFHLARLFIASNKENIEHILKLCKQKNIVKKDENGRVVRIDGNTVIDLSSLLKEVSLFISSKKTWNKRIKNNNTPHGLSDSQTGRYEDFTRNIELFDKMGLDIEASYNKCSYIFVYPNMAIKYAMKNLELYGITSQEYLNTLSSLRTTNQSDILDRYIELGYLDYAKETLSYLGVKTVESPMFYKIARLQQLNITIPKSNTLKYLPKEITYDNKELKIILQDAQEEYINKNNAKKLTQKYTPVFEKGLEYDQITSKSLNNSIDISKEDEIITLLDSKYISEYHDEFSNQTYSSILSRKTKINNNELEIEEENEEPLVYNICGIQISRLKVLRIYDTLLANGLANDLDSIMYSITKNSIITKEQYDKIHKEISGLLETKINTKGRSFIR